ncbi:hypothetical protein QAD02_008948 [Eretmocerus hayati]|uniref:Uncharacterized protein n=1 Tax=Eretmocerus hayati TaxID=131215 RepID=A0ACC2N9C8_9HYME|nr:hypothetical protein QAD02_008948 [Eretmocerus hayati]
MRRLYYYYDGHKSATVYYCDRNARFGNGVGGGSRTTGSDGPWYENVPIPPIAYAKSALKEDGNGLNEGSCRRQLREYLDGLANGSLWATQMYDASAKQPYGVIDGQTRHLGSFDQCYRLDARLANNDRVQGRYCLVDYKYEQLHTLSSFRKKLDFDFDPNESAWEAIKERGDFRRIKRYMLQMALCVPAACSAEDVEQALQSPYQDFAAKNNLKVKVTVEPKNCQAYREEPEVGTGTIVYCTLVGTIVALVAMGSLYDSTISTDEERIRSSRGRQLLLCFSAQRNLRTIFEVSYKHRGLDTIHLLRFISMCLVLIGHRMMQYYLNTVVNERYLELTFNVPSFVMVHNGTIIVDGFFAIGGLLTCYGLLYQFDKTKRMNFFGLLFIRVLRLTPAYALLIFFNIYVFPHIGSGPHWQSKIGLEAENCASTWWANLLYVNNYLTMERLCVFQSWYLSVDFHCYLVSIFCIYAFWKCPRKIGYSLLGIATFISAAGPFYLTYVHRIQPIFIGFPFLNGLSMDPYFLNYYVKSHLRMTAYLVGVIAGAMLYDFETDPSKASWRISKRWSQILFILLVVVLGLTSQALGYQYYNPNSNPSSLEMALYASLHRGTFAASFCAVVLLIAVGDGLDLHYNFLTPGWAQPLGRLTYSVFLTHNIIQSYQAATVRSARTFSIHNSVWDFIPDVFYSFSLALLIAIGIEGPFRRMEKCFIMRQDGKSKRNTTLTKHGTERVKVKKID